MAQLYNPDLMSEQELRETFVARQDVVDEMLSVVRHQPDGAGVQHVVIIAPRGMGKTTLLLMVQLGIQDQGLDSEWQYVRFAEESYGVYDLADFWMHVLENLSADAGEPALQVKAEGLRKLYTEAGDLAEAALALLKDWCKEHGRRLVLLVDNFDLILGQIDNESDSARLRQVLMNDGCMMLIGGATTFFHEARSYDQPLYNFFKIVHLRPLSHEEIVEMLKQRAVMDDRADFEGTLEANRTRVRVLEYFTGGNPRLVLMLYRVLAKSEVLEVRRGMENLLDQVTPFYKDKMESLPAQQRKILDQIARVSAETHEGVTPTSIAGATRLKPNAVSSQLKRLADLGYVRAANVKGRNAYYTLSEPLYAIWHQMRFGRAARTRMQWLVDFLKGWYDAKELGTESQRLEARFRELVQTGCSNEAREALEHRRYLAAAMAIDKQGSIVNRLVEDYIELRDIDALKNDVLKSIDVGQLSEETLAALVKEGCLDEPVGASHQGRPSRWQDSTSGDVRSSIAAAFREGRHSDALALASAAAVNDPSNARLLALKGLAAFVLRRYEEAAEALGKAIPSTPVGFVGSLLETHALALQYLGRSSEALVSAKAATELQPGEPASWLTRAVSGKNLNLRDEVVLSLNRAVDLGLRETHDLKMAATLYNWLGESETALHFIDSVVEANTNDEEAWRIKGVTLSKLNRAQEAIDCLDRAVALEATSEASWISRGDVLLSLERLEDARKSFTRAVQLDSRSFLGWRGLSITNVNLGKLSDAIEAAQRSLDINPDSDFSAVLCGVSLLSLGRTSDGLRSLEGAIAINQRTNGPDMNRRSTHELLFAAYCAEAEWDKAAEHWNQIVELGANEEDWTEQAAGLLQRVATVENAPFVLKLINDAGLQDRLTPLHRALTFLQSGDEAVVERLSPEVREASKQIIAELRQKAEASKDS